MMQERMCRGRWRVRGGIGVCPSQLARFAPAIVPKEEGLSLLAAGQLDTGRAQPCCWFFLECPNRVCGGGARIPPAHLGWGLSRGRVTRSTAFTVWVNPTRSATEASMTGGSVTLYTRPSQLCPMGEASFFRGEIGEFDRGGQVFEGNHHPD